MTPEMIMADALSRARTRGPVSRLGVAVSGGGDSMALLIMAHDWCVANNATLMAATVDHGLRSDAAAEAQFVLDTCTRLRIPHEVLRWAETPSGNLQDAARRARYDLLAGWGKRQGLDAVLLGHTADDQAETFVMRLARGSGVDGLAQMRDDWCDRGMRWLRPLLHSGRSALRDELTKRGQNWVEDPSNEDQRFGRVRVRQAMQDLSNIGLDRSRLVDTANRMQDARDALSWFAHDAAKRLAAVVGGDVLFEIDGFVELPNETRHRLLAHAIQYVSSTRYRPRYSALRALEDDVLGSKPRTLQGCLVSMQRNTLVIGRELQSVAGHEVAPEALWDGRWIVTAPAGYDATQVVVKALGEGISHCKDWRATGYERNTLITSPALWAEERLIAAPMAGYGAICPLKRVPRTEDFLSTILSH